MTKFHYIKNRKIRGPFTLDELKYEFITLNTLIWYPGLKNWVKAKNVIGLNDVFISSSTASTWAANGDLIIDCRSSTYQGVWTPDLNKTVGIRVFTIKNGKKSVVTHMSKKTRGDVAKLLVQSAKTPKTALELQKLINKKFKSELVKPTNKTSWFLDVIA